ncbi:MAG: AAA family ATPase [Microthrixaceae bacterium]|nr:AAA family ATPase [Microthrixaceae bacterium]
MSNPVLGPVVETFIEEVTSALTAATARLSDVDKSHFNRDVTNEAFDLALALIDADDRHTDEELEALIDTFAPLLPDSELSRATPETLRYGPLVSGTKKWLDAESELFELLLEADVRNNRSGSDSRYSGVYYDHALDIAHVIASLDVLASTATLEAISLLRTRLLRRITDVLPNAARAPLDSAAGSETSGTKDSDPDHPEMTPARPLEELLAELDDLVGLHEVKARVRLVADLLVVQNLRRERSLPTMEISHHLVFTGNPGTGKTTVARLLAQIYRTLGVVDVGQLIETDRSELVAGYVGQTAPKVTAKFDEADEGILFIDEAYALARGGENDFGREAIDQIVKLMEDRRDRVVLIVAGYPVEMEEFISTNPGLRSRFPTTIEFPDYSNEELLKIVDSIGSKMAYRLTDDARRKFLTELDAIPRDKGFGNARVARNMFEAAVNRQASRIVKMDAPDDEALTTLEESDIAGPDANPETDADAAS